MYSCCHEQGDDPYASGNENRRRNRDRLNEQITAHNLLRRIRGYGHGLSFGGPRGMPGGMFGFGPRGQPPFSGHRGHPRLPAYPVKDVKDLRPAYRSAMTTTLIRTMICTLYHGFHSHHRGMALPQQACNDLVYGLRLTGAVVI